MDSFFKEWPTIAAAPISFASAVAACAILIFLAIRFLYGREIAILKAHVALIQQQLGFAKEQRDNLDSELRDAKVTVSDLRTQIANLPGQVAQTPALEKLASTTSGLESSMLKIVKLSNELGSTITPSSTLTR
jgi:F0F1-type ATP synthase membrane subunit b/b'